MDENRIPRAALLLGIAGILPFLACAAALVMDLHVPGIDDPSRAMIAYGAVILSFLGGVRWGFALRITDDGLQARALVLSVCPSIAAWLLLLAPTLMGLLAMPILFILLELADEQLPRIGVPEWYRTLRRGLTIAVVLTLLSGIYGLTN